MDYNFCMPRTVSPNRKEIGSLLRSSLPAERLELLRLVADEAAGRRLPVYIIGGFVRDLLLGRSSQDFDLVVEGSSLPLARALAARHGGKVTIHDRFGTAKWALRGTTLAAAAQVRYLDLITARRETYSHPGALPDVAPGTIDDDLARRDFTINCLAIRLDGGGFGELRDDWGGLADLGAGTVRVLHPDSYRDDPTRILRAVRYEQRYGFRLAECDLEYIATARATLESLSADRIRHELDAILLEANAPAILERLARMKVLKAIHPALPWNQGIFKLLLAGMDAQPPLSWSHIPDLLRIPRRVALGYILWLLGLGSDELQALDARLHFPAALRDAILQAAFLRDELPFKKGIQAGTIFERLKAVPPLSIFAAYLSSGKESRAILDRYMSEWRRVRLSIDGDDLIALGLEPGPAFQKILRTLRDAWLDGEIHTVEQEKELLRKMIAGS